MKKLIAFAVASAIAGGAFAANVGTAIDTAQWQVTATKDSNARLVVSPIGKIDFKYSPVSKGFAPTDAAFMVDILNNNPNAGSGEKEAKNFKLVAWQTEGYAQHIDGSGVGFDVELDMNGKPLGDSLATASTVNDTSTDEAFLAKLDGLLAGESSDKGAFKAFVKTTDGTPAENLTDGSYIGQATVEFKATWE